MPVAGGHLYLWAIWKSGSSGKELGWGVSTVLRIERPEFKVVVSGDSHRLQVPVPQSWPHWGLGCLESMTTISRQKFASRQSSEIKRRMPRAKCGDICPLWFSPTSLSPHPTWSFPWPVRAHHPPCPHAQCR